MSVEYDSQEATMELAGIPTEEVKDETSSELGKKYCLYFIDPFIQVEKERGVFVFGFMEEEKKQIKDFLDELQLTVQECKNGVWKIEDPRRLIYFQKEEKGFFERSWKIMFSGRCIGMIQETGPIYNTCTTVRIDWTEYKLVSSK